MVESAEKGIIGKIKENGMPVIYSFDNYLPPQKTLNKLPSLVVIKWKYDGSKNNGMPSKDEQEKIYKLEDVLEKLANDGVSFRAYSRTGNNLREFVYYCKNQKSFLHFFNQAVEGHPRYLIEIVFYDDPEWTDYKKLMNSFKGG